MRRPAILQNADFGLLAGMLVVVLGLFSFFAIADEVFEGDTRELDEWVVRQARDPVDPARIIGPPFVTEVMRDLTALGGFVVVGLITTFTCGFLLLAGKRRTLGFVVVAVGGGIGLSMALKHLFARPRPQLVPHLSVVMTSSFPSGHSALSAVVYITLAALLARLVDSRRLKAYLVATAMLLTVLVGISRVVMGVHYPSDVLAGWSIGIVWAMTCWSAMRALQRRRVVDLPAHPVPEPSSQGSQTSA